MRKNLIVCSMLLLSAYRTSAQENEPLPTNEEYVTKGYDVDLFTGIANVGIPIYKYSLDGLDLDIGINYNTKGIKVDDYSSSIGLGWELSINNSIVREPVGLEDEISVPAVGSNYGLRGAWSNRYLSNMNAGGGNDIFHLNLGGRALDFQVFFDNPSHPYGVPIRVSPYNDIKIELIDANNNVITNEFASSFGSSVNDKFGFRITDEKGNIFEFERGDYRGKNYYYKSSSGSYTYYSTDKWNIKRITTYSGLVIEYTYNNYNVSFPLQKRESFTEFNIINSNSSSPNWMAIGLSSSNPLITSRPSWMSFGIYYDSETVVWGGNKSHISQIKYPNGVTAYFNMSTTSRCDIASNMILDNITIESKYDNIVGNKLKYKFYNAYFSTPINVSGFNTSEIPLVNSSIYYNSLSNSGYNQQQIQEYFNLGLRLKLKKITRIGNGNINNEEPFYSFEYIAENDNSRALPFRLSEKQDWLGYCNNAAILPLDYNFSTINTSIARHPITDDNGYGDYGVDKNSVFYYMVPWTLKKMVNPDGGSVEFVYKEHVLSNPPNTNFPSDYDVTNISDGLCIDKIIYKDGFSVDNDRQTVYSYNNGYRFYPGVYFWEALKYFYADPKHSSNAPVAKRTYYNKCITPLVGVRGSYHGYTNVKVENKGYNNEILSSKEYLFTNIIDPSTNSSYLAYSDKPYEHSLGSTVPTYKIGLLKEVKSYIGASSIENSKIQYSYIEHLGPTNLQAKTTWQDNYYTYTASNQTGNFFGSHTRFYVNMPVTKVRLSYINKYQYSGNTTKFSQINYDYDDYNLVHTKILDENNQRTIIENKYNYQYQNLLPGKQHLISTFLYKHASGGADAITYKVMRPIVINNKILPQSNFQYLSDKPYQAHGLYTFDDATVISNNTSTALLKKVYENISFDQNNNATEVKYGDIDKYSCSFWDNQIGRKVASISNSQLQDVAAASFEGVNSKINPTIYDLGGWNYNPNYVVLASSTLFGKAATGKYCYQLNTSDVISKNLSPNKEYILTFWSTTSHIDVKLSGNSLSPISAGRTINSSAGGPWHLYTIRFTTSPFVSNPVLTIGYISSGLIDELRIHPDKAMMTTYTHEPLFGISSICDPNNNITYYEYDDFGRNTIIRDIDHNIISKKSYTVQGADN